MNFKLFSIKRFKPNTVLALAIGLVYLWFGALKFFPNLSPAEDLAKRTMEILTFGLIPSSVTIILLACMEVLIGLLLIFHLYPRQAVKLAIIHIIFTFSPLLFFPEDCFTLMALTPTLLGQYIGKNFIILAALYTLLKEKSKV